MEKIRPHLARIKQTGATVFIHRCSECGDKNAPFGFDVKMQGKDRNPGTWFCGHCVKDVRKAA